ncbi:hypothetical protein X777_04705 [Ooceraea biroi]|uniref:Uncharacterized protein n=1 Tax=Ooceraea biroi TaxID=2015173 RepID=A0A026X3C2_OOCBI|nr:hypothetical protein X777_04705 [Ooceraea biroi]
MRKSGKSGPPSSALFDFLCGGAARLYMKKTGLNKPETRSIVGSVPLPVPRF